MMLGDWMMTATKRGWLTLGIAYAVGCAGSATGAVPAVTSDNERASNEGIPSTEQGDEPVFLETPDQETVDDPSEPTLGMETFVGDDLVVTDQSGRDALARYQRIEGNLTIDVEGAIEVRHLALVTGTLTIVGRCADIDFPALSRAGDIVVRGSTLDCGQARASIRMDVLQQAGTLLFENFAKLQEIALPSLRYLSGGLTLRNLGALEVLFADQLLSVQGAIEIDGVGTELADGSRLILSRLPSHWALLRLLRSKLMRLELQALRRVHGDIEIHDVVIDALTLPAEEVYGDIDLHNVVTRRISLPNLVHLDNLFVFAHGPLGEVVTVDAPQLETVGSIWLGDLAGDLLAPALRTIEYGFEVSPWGAYQAFCDSLVDVGDAFGSAPLFSLSLPPSESGRPFLAGPFAYTFFATPESCNISESNGPTVSPLL